MKAILGTINIDTNDNALSVRALKRLHELVSEQLTWSGCISVWNKDGTGTGSEVDIMSISLDKNDNIVAELLKR